MSLTWLLAVMVIFAGLLEVQAMDRNRDATKAIVKLVHIINAAHTTGLDDNKEGGSFNSFICPGGSKVNGRCVVPPKIVKMDFDYDDNQ